MKLLIRYAWFLNFSALGLTLAVTVLSFKMDVNTELRLEHEYNQVVVLLSTCFARGWMEADLMNVGGAFSGEFHPQNLLGGINEVIRTPDGGFYYAARVPLWEPIALLSIWPICFLFVAFLRRRRGKAGSCRKCGYSLTGNTSGVCPECGTRVSSASDVPAR
jgi:hypothetical protein